MNWFRYYFDKYRHRNNGLVKHRSSKKDYKYEEHFVVSGSGQYSTLMPSLDKTVGVDLRPHFKPVGNQRSTQSCTGFAAQGMIEYLLTTEFAQGWRKISPLYTWYYGKKYHGWQDEDKGVSLRNTLKSIFAYGAVYNASFSFKTPYTRKPTPFVDALGLMVRDFYLNKKRFAYYILDKWSLKDALNKKYPVVVGLWLNNSFYGNRTGTILNTKNNGSSHAMLIVGYDDNAQQYIVRNSWGSFWGKNGYCFIPFDYFNANVHDLWTIRRRSK